MPSGVYDRINNRGWKHSEETKKKMSLASSKPERILISINNSKKGQFKKGHNWKGGQRNYLRKLRQSVLEALGGKCQKCGFEDKRALQIDHINGGGSKERKEKGFGGNFHKHVLKSFMANEQKYQLLCANCNWIKRFENKEALGRII